MKAGDLEPATEKVRLRVNQILQESKVHSQHLQLLELWKYPLSSTHLSLVGILGSRNGERKELFCKGGAYKDFNSFGHRGGIAYEVQVYEQILEPTGVSTPRFLGSYLNHSSDEAWIFLEYLKNNVTVAGGQQPDALSKAAEWIGSFHRMAEVFVEDSTPSFLKNYDAHYYKGWAARTIEFAKPFIDKYKWLPKVCRSFVQIVPELMASSQTVIHGEYYASNIQLCGDEIRPVDWESTAIAAGEIDLAALTEAWPRPIQQKCERAYGRVRWGNDTPDQFHRRLELARLYLCFRWLGDDREWSTKFSQVYENLGRLQSIAKRTGLIE